MFPKEYIDLQVLLTKYNLPVWSKLEFRCYSDGKPCLELMIGEERIKPVYRIMLDKEAYFNEGILNDQYRQLKAYLDTHYTPVKLPRWPM